MSTREDIMLAMPSPVAIRERMQSADIPSDLLANLTSHIIQQLASRQLPARGVCMALERAVNRTMEGTPGRPQDYNLLCSDVIPAALRVIFPPANYEQILREWKRLQESRQ